MTGKWRIALPVLLLLGAAAAYAMLRGDKSDSAADGLESLLTGQMSVFELAADRPAMPFDVVLEGSEGPASFGDFRGRVLLVNLWAEWCAPCIEELPTLAALETALGGKDFRVLPVSLDRAPVEEAQAVLGKFGVTGLETLADREMALMDRLGIIGLPATFLVDREGREIGRLVGPADWASEEARALVEAALADRS